MRHETQDAKICGYRFAKKTLIADILLNRDSIYRLRILRQKLLMALMKLGLEITVCEAWTPSNLSRSRMTFDRVRFFLVKLN